MNFDHLVQSLRELDGSLKRHVKSTANVALTLRNWLVGAYIVAFEQNGEDRAQYGDRLIPEIATAIGLKGLDVRNLANSRSLFCEYPEILQTLSAKSSQALPLPILQTLSAKFPEAFPHNISQTLSAKSEALLPATGKSQTLSGKSARPDFAPPVEVLVTSLSFSHFVELLRVHDPLQRAFYEIECIKGGWSVRELKRQIGSLLFERLGLSTDKAKLLRLTQAEASQAAPADVIKDPYIFEFLGLQPQEVFREHDLETALLDNLQAFLLELGSGFCFEDRQKRIRIGSEDFFVDLVFYHRKLHCHVLIELKVEPFNHTNAGQLNTYLNYYRKHEMQPGDAPPVGLLLCTDKNHALVEYALGGMDENRFVSTYQVALPDKETLKQFLEEKAAQL